MGSNQSSTSDGGADSRQPTTISIDPSGNITRRSNLQSSSSHQPTHSLADTNQDDQENPQQQQHQQHQESRETFAATEQQQQQQQQQQHKHQQSEPISVDTKRPVGFDYSLEQADEITNILKNRYKPQSAEMAGKFRSPFEEVERNVIHCYKTNKNQLSKCSQVVDEYQKYVQQQRSERLKMATKFSKTTSTLIPTTTIITTIIVILTCLLLHVTTIHCFGAMSIDLGSEWMKVGLVAPNVQMDIVLNAQSQRKTAMAIAFANGERYIGDTALDIASKYPEKTFTHFLDLVGKSIDHETVKHYKRRFPYADIKSHEPNSTSIILNHPDGLQLTPLELIAMMLQHAHDQVLTRLNSNEPANDVVITVPPFFNSKERKVIRDAAKLVGLKVLRLTNVNSAFALSYGVFRHKDYLLEPTDGTFDNRTSILFFDQGASHTSVTLADYNLVEQIDETTLALKNETLPTITIRAHVFDRYLGGFDMQLKLRDYFVDEFSKLNKIDKERIYKRGRSTAKLLKESGRVKRVLSANSDHLVRVENVIDDKDMRLPISRQQFEELNKEYLDDRIRQLLDRLYEKPGVSRSDKIDSVIVVGGNTRTPRIQQVLMDYFKLDTLGKSINADEGAALAALYQAASLGRGFRVKKFILEEYGDLKRRYDPSKTTTTTSTTTTTTPAPEQEASSTEAVDASSTTSTTTTEAPKSFVKIVDPDSIYCDSELDRIKRRLTQMREQDFLRLQRLSLKNSLESLLSEAKDKLNGEEDEQPTEVKELFKAKRDEIQKTVSETYNWLEDGPLVETNNVTLLADKYTAIYDLIHPKPPTTTTAAPEYEETKLDLSSVLLNNTLNMLRNLTNSFNSQNATQEEVATPSPEVAAEPQVPSDEAPSSSVTTSEPPQARLDPPHIEL